MSYKLTTINRKSLAASAFTLFIGTILCCSMPLAAAQAYIVNGSSWFSCYGLNVQNSSSGCFNIGTSTYALTNVDINYTLASPGLNYGLAEVKINYRQQKDKSVPANYPGYKVRIMMLAGRTWVTAADVVLPAGAPGVAKTFTTQVYAPSINGYNINYRLQWYNDVSSGAKDSNLQIDSSVLTDLGSD